MKTALIIIGVLLALFVLFFVVPIVAIAWCHHPEGIIKAYKNRRKNKDE